MSLFAILYAADPPTPGGGIAIAFPGHVAHTVDHRVQVHAEAIEASASTRTKPNFDLELFGFEPVISIYFALDDERSTEARRQLAAAVSSFLRGTSGAAALMYLDVLVLTRIGQAQLCATAYTDMIPDEASGWTIVPSLPQPE
jgi:hypothetical protein